MAGTGNPNFAVSPLSMWMRGGNVDLAAPPEQLCGCFKAPKCLAGGEEGAAVDVMIFPG